MRLGNSSLVTTLRRPQVINIKICYAKLWYWQLLAPTQISIHVWCTFVKWINDTILCSHLVWPDIVIKFDALLAMFAILYLYFVYPMQVWPWSNVQHPKCLHTIYNIWREEIPQHVQLMTTLKVSTREKGRED